MVICIPSAELGSTSKVIFVVAGGDDAVALKADDGADLHGRHIESFLDGEAGGEARGSGDGEEDGDVGFGTGGAPEDLFVAFARDEGGRDDRRGQGSASVGEGSASVEKTAVGGSLGLLAALIVMGVGGNGWGCHLRPCYCVWRIGAELGLSCRRQGKRCYRGDVDSKDQNGEG